MYPVPRQRQTNPPPLSLWSHLRRFWNRSRVVLTASGVAFSVMGLRFAGLLQPLELATIDQGFRWRAPQPVDDRIVIVGITEQDIRSLNQWPLSDQKLAELLRKIQAHNPRSIGLDLYRDLQQATGSEEINQIFRQRDNIFGIILLQAPEASTPDKPNGYIAVRPAVTLAAKGQIGFNNTIQDTDQRVRRSLLYWQVTVDDVDAQGKAITRLSPGLTYNFRLCGLPCP